MKPLLTTPLSSPTPVSASGALRIISEQSMKLAPGQRVTMQVHREGNGLFTLSNGSQSITVEGLPTTIANGTRITIFTSSRGSNTLRWIIAPEAEKNINTPANNTLNIKQVAIEILGEKTVQQHGQASTLTNKNIASHAVTDHSPTPKTINVPKTGLLSSLKTGTSLTGKVTAHEGQQMTLKLAVTNSSASNTTARYQGSIYATTTPFELTTAAIPNKQVGNSIVASLQRDSKGSPLLLVATEVKTTNTTQTTLPPSITQRMQSGEQAIGLVQQKLTDGQLRIGVRGSEIIAPSPPNRWASSIKVGDGLILRMQTNTSASTPTIEIRQHLPNLLPSLQQKIRQLLPDTPPISKSIENLRKSISPTPQASPNTTQQHQALETWLQRAQHNSSTPITGPRIATLIRDAGQLLEHKLLQLTQQPSAPSSTLDHDLKAVLSKLASPPSQPSPQSSTLPLPPLAPLAAEPSLPAAHHQQQQQLTHKAIEAAQQGVQRIESSQMHAALSAIHHEPMRVEFPMVVFNQLVTVQMAIMEQQQQHHTAEHPDDGKYFNILMALNLSHLGEVRIDSSISSDTVLASIHLASDQTTQFAQQHLHRLTSKMQAAGFAHIQIVIANQPPSPSKQQDFAQLTSMVPTTTSLLDIEI